MSGLNLTFNEVNDSENPIPFWKFREDWLSMFDLLKEYVDKDFIIGHSTKYAWYIKENVPCDFGCWALHNKIRALI